MGRKADDIHVSDSTALSKVLKLKIFIFGTHPHSLATSGPRERHANFSGIDLMNAYLHISLTRTKL